MGGELLTGEGAEKSAPLKYKEVFQKALPFYLCIGMSADDFWNGDCELAKYYRQAHELKKQEINEQLWLQGLYVYEAILNASPMLRDWVKDHRPKPYPSKPHPLTESKLKQEKEEEKKEATTAQKARMMAWAKKVNAKMEKKDE